MYIDAVSVEDRLRTALTTNRLTPQQTTRAEALLSRLVSPVRIAVMGQRGAGKTSVVNLLAGAPVLPLSVALPTAQLSWGESEETICTYGDKSRRSFAQATTADLTEGRPIFLAMRRDLPALRRIALLEVVMDGAPSSQAQALTWASGRCDIAIWCTTSFDAVEQALWAGMPAPVKKHALLALTHADKLRGRDTIERRMAEVRANAGNGFHNVHPVNARDGLRALSEGAGAEDEAFRRTGAAALSVAVFDKVNAGYTRVREAAEALLDDVALSAARAATPTAAPVAEAAQPPLPREPAAQQAVQQATMPQEPSGRASGPGSSPAPEVPPSWEAVPTPTGHVPASTELGHRAVSPAEETPETAKAAAPDAAAPRAPVHDHTDDQPVAMLPETQAEHPKAAPTRLSNEGRATVDGAISYLARRGATWADVARHSPDAASRQIMEDVLGDAEWLASYLNDHFQEDEALLAPSREMATEIVDLVMLMEIERTDTATVDAVCLLLQAQRRLQALAAAA